MNMSNLSENIPSDISIDVQQLFPDDTTQHIQPFDDEYFDDPVIVKLNKKSKRKVKQLQEGNTEVNSGERSQNLTTNEGVSVLIEGNPDFGGENMSQLPGLDSENTSGSSAISLIPTMKISQNDRIRYDGIIAHSDNSNDSLIESSELFNPRTPETTVNNNMEEIEIGEYNEVNDKKQDSTYNQDPKNKNPKIKPNGSTTETKWSSSTSESDIDDDKQIQKRSKTRLTKEKNIYQEDSKNKNINIKPNNRKTKIKCPSSSDSDSDNPIKKRNKISHRKWSDEEIKLVKKYFQSYINKKINPGKNKCMEVLNKEPILQKRTWMQLNTYVNNIYKKK